ncbi:MAG: hypothetical protein H6825_12900 [Planctomycetes bacterium]|nr:hypothetical protein [Planctomycetota bacterium]
MIRLGSLIAIVLWGASASAQEVPGEPRSPEQDWARLEGLLRARDEALVSVYLPYTAWEVNLDASAVSDESESTASAASDEKAFDAGWWAMDGDRFAFSRTFSSTRRVDVHFTWDGARCKILTVQPALLKKPEDGVYASLMEVYPRWTRREWQDALHLPGEFGFAFSGQRWSQWNEYMVDFQVVGREVVDGVDCLVVQFDFGSAGEVDDGRYSVPWMVWFDDHDTLLARRRMQYVPYRESLARGERPHLGPPRQFGQELFYPSCLWSLTETREINGTWVQAAGTYTSATMDGERQVRIHVGEGATINTDIPARCFEFDPPPGTQLIDSIEGRNVKLSVGPREQSHMQDDLRRCELAVRELGQIAASAGAMVSFESTCDWLDARLEADEIAELHHLRLTAVVPESARGVIDESVRVTCGALPEVSFRIQGMIR